ncbi:MAG: hypothetical protein AAB431_03510 [Patescibacteria group bacterium]
MIFPSGNPWMFHRDEIDLLEEEMETIYQQHERAATDSVSEMEQRILREQIETEEQFEAELSLKMEPEHFLRRSLPSEEAPAFLKEEPLDDLLRSHVQRDPLYEAVYLWVARVFSYAHQRYIKEAIRSEDFFRIYVSVKMIPIKLSGVQVDPTIPDVVSQQIAKKDAQLCLIYFARTLDSLHHLSFLGDERATVLAKEGLPIERAIRAELTRGKIL